MSSTSDSSQDESVIPPLGQANVFGMIPPLQRTGERATRNNERQRQREGRRDEKHGYLRKREQERDDFSSGVLSRAQLNERNRVDRGLGGMNRNHEYVRSEQRRRGQGGYGESVRSRNYPNFGENISVGKFV